MEGNSIVLFENLCNIFEMRIKLDKEKGVMSSLDVLSNYEKYAKKIDSIYNGGDIDNPDICFVFMNPTGKNIASHKSWKGRKSPWLGTKNIWKLFYKVNLLNKEVFNEIQEKKPKDWDYEFCDFVYEQIANNKLFITNLGKCTQIDARPLPDEVLKKYLDLLFKEIDIIKPKVIITFGNQVSSILLEQKVSVSEWRKKFAIINVSDLEVFDADTVVDAKALQEKGLVKKVCDGVKVLGNGTVSKAVTVKASAFSESAKTKIEAAGGKAEVI